jgi:hypothetical protein
MNEPALLHYLLLVREAVVASCETLVFIVLVVSLTAHTIKLIVKFGQKE